MTRIGYAKPQMFVILEALVTTARPSCDTRSNYSLTGFGQLQGSTHTFTGWVPAPPQVSYLSAPSSPDVTNRAPPLPHTAHRFSQPLSSNYAPQDSQVCSTLQALVGSWPSEFYRLPIRDRLQPLCSFVVICPSWVSSCD